MKHKGYNGNYNPLGNSTAQKFKYNGIEYEESLGLNLYEMDFRMYDPAIARFNGIDPVTHHSQGTSVAFDNNPIFWADPSGADGIGSVADIQNLAGSGGSGDFYQRGNNGKTKTLTGGWTPNVDKDGNVSYVAEKGATAKSFVEQYGKIHNIDEEQALFLIGAADNDIKAGKTSVSGSDIDALIKTPILKLNLKYNNSRWQRTFNQILFAVDYSRSIGDKSFSPRDYFSDTYEYVINFYNVSYDYKGETYNVISGSIVFGTMGTYTRALTDDIEFGSSNPNGKGIYTQNVELIQTGPKSSYMLEAVKFQVNNNYSNILRSRLQSVKIADNKPIKLKQ